MQETGKDRKAQIPEQLDGLGHEINKLETSIDQLKERLQPVMRIREDHESSVTVPEDNLVDLANCIRDNTHRVSSMVDVVTSMLTLLEL